jgi:hypothetical protein
LGNPLNEGKQQKKGNTMGIEDYNDSHTFKKNHSDEHMKNMDELIERHITALFEEANVRNICGECIIKSLMVSIMGTALVNFGLKDGVQTMETAAKLSTLDFMTGRKLSKVIRVNEQKKH